MWDDRHCKAARSPKQPNGNAGSAYRLVAAALAALLALLAPGSPPPARGETFEVASLRALREISSNGWGTGPLADFNENFPAGVVSAAPATTTQQAGGASAIERRLQTVRESEERRRSSGVAPAMYASYLSDATQTDDRLQLPRLGGAGSEIVVGLTHGLSVFLSAGASLLQHHENRFEDGYTAHQPTATIGADYLFTPRLLGGVTFTYTRVDGSYDSAGDFDKDVFSPAVYGLFLPFEGAFVSAFLSYARNENSNHRTVTIPNVDGFVVTGQAFGEYVEHQVSADFQIGYDHRLGNFTVGPRFGLAIGHSHIDAFSEEGDSGGELRYSDFDQTSVQSKLGVAASVAIKIPNGVLLPQANVAWVHEYANDERDVRARFIHASPSPTFTFRRERPARDWANIALGVSASLGNGWQPFVQFVTVQGNTNYVSYGGTAGLRFSF
jgi:outer membrane autotransporter protein